MGVPKGEGRSRGSRSKADRRAEGTRQGSKSGTIERSEIEEVEAVGSKGYEGQGRSSTAVLERVVEAPPLEMLEAAPTQLPDDSANSNHRADMVLYAPPPLALPSGDSPEVSRGSREHTQRLESASVLDAPASMTESVSPPKQNSWALKAWVAAMLSIIAAAGIVALREQGARPSSSEPAAELSPSVPAAPNAGPSQVVSPVVGTAGSTGVTAVAPVVPGVSAPAATPPALPATAESEAEPDPDSPEGRAKARRAARREAAELAAAEAAAAAVVADASKVSATLATRPPPPSPSEKAFETTEPKPAEKTPEKTSAPPEAAAAPAPAPAPAEVAGPAPAAPREPSAPMPQIPGNPYGSDDATGTP
ncbi:MAG: hypothetical protein QM778_03780 [Myxococcales bacterium]